MKKIMFNDYYGLTKAVLEGRKTQTRRIVAEQQLRTILHFPKHADRNFDELIEGCKSNEYGVKLFAPYVNGEEVAIAQKYSECNRAVCLVDSKGWNNKMFVCADLMPHRIKITNVRVERLQDISDEDCLKEGIDEDKLYSFGKLNEHLSFDTPREAFAALINKVSGKGTWERNPWVFVYDFELKK